MDTRAIIDHCTVRDRAVRTELEVNVAIYCVIKGMMVRGKEDKREGG